MRAIGSAVAAVVLAALTAAAAAPAAPAAPAPATVLRGAAAAAKMRATLGATTRSRANFQQTVSDGRGAVVQRSSGSFTAEQPRRLNWQVRSPSAQSLITDGDRIWLYDPDLAQVTVGVLDTETAEAPMLILSGQVGTLTSKYDISAEGGGSNWRFVMKLRSAAVTRGPSFEQLTLEVVDGDVRAMHIRDTLEQRTDVMLSAVEHPAQVDARLFHFVIPAGVEVVQR